MRLHFGDVAGVPRLPLEGSIELTYRCNNDCMHCWLKVEGSPAEIEKELTAGEIRKIVDDARRMGCRHWFISGGEPMLRPDFPEIFDCITSRSLSYTLNTNGTLVTPQTARLLKRPGTNLIALYGATAKTHDRVTRTPGSFEALRRGFAYLKEGGAGFVVQIIPMKENYHEFRRMIDLALSVSSQWRVGSPWLFLPPPGDARRRRRIAEQRLHPADVVRVDMPNMLGGGAPDPARQDGHCGLGEGDFLFSGCIRKRCAFHISPYGQMTQCIFSKEPSFQYDLRKGSFADGWNSFIPSLAKKARGGLEYRGNCGSCELRADCRWCPAVGYLEHGRFSAKVDYLCRVAAETDRFKRDWTSRHCRHFQLGGMSLRVVSDLPMTDKTFDRTLRLFEVQGPGQEAIQVSHHFGIPDLDPAKLGEVVYSRPPWRVYRRPDAWIYVCFSERGGAERIHSVVVLNRNHTKARIHNATKDEFRKGRLRSLTLLPSDEVLLAVALAEKNGCYLHAGGAILGGKGLLFAGHSEAGKSTIAEMLEGKAEILGDERIIVRRHPEGFRIYGTWSHGDASPVSAFSAPLRGIFFLRKSRQNRLVRLAKAEAVRAVLSCLIRPLVTREWLQKMMGLVGKIGREIPCYRLYFDRSGRVVDLLRGV